MAEAGPDDPAVELTEPIRPAKRSWRYRVALGAVAVAMVVLPALYLALTLGIALLVWRHATLNADLFAAGARARYLLYLAPLFAGSLAVFFLVKPLFARRVPRFRPLRLDPAAQPRLFAFVRKLCEAVGAPAPQAIEVDCDVNAAAGFRRGMLGILGTDLKITIGLSLVAGQDLRRFTGVLAHEMGHFTQRSGMRLSSVIRAMNWWLYRVVVERDAWDHRLARWTQTAPYAVLRALLLATRGGIWLSRRLLAVLMRTGRLISCALLRQMEYDADRTMARTVGAETLAEALLGLQELALAANVAWDDLEVSWRDRRLADDIPALVVAWRAQLSEAERNEIREAGLSARTRFLDTHPSVGDRIRAARRRGQPGVFRDERPARDLFAGFEELCREASLLTYRQQLGAEVSERNLVPAAALFLERRRARRSGRALARVYQGTFRPAAPFFPGPLRVEEPIAPEPARAMLEALRAEVRSRAGAARVALFVTARDAEQGERAARLARTLADCRIRVRTRDPGLPGTDPAELARTEQSAAAERTRALAGTRAFQAVARERLSVALRLLLNPWAADAAGADREETGRLLGILPVLRTLHERFLDLEARHAHLDGILEHLARHRNHEPLQRRARQVATELHRSLAAFLDGTDRPYPFRHARPGITLGEYLLPGPFPVMEDARALIGAVAQAERHYAFLVVRVFARLAELVELAEAVVGLAPLPAPEPGPGAEGTAPDPGR